MGRFMFTCSLVLIALWSQAQTTAPYLKEVLTLNGGQYGDPTQNVVLTAYDPSTGIYRQSDTIHTESIQDMVLDEDVAYIAAQDSIVKIDLTDMSRLAIAEFPSNSTYSLLKYDSYLLVGNWYNFGPNDTNLYVYNASDLTLHTKIGNTQQGVNGMAVLNDTLYIAQNLTSSAYSDSAGYISVIDLSTFSFVRNIPGDNVSDVGKLIVRDNKIWSFNGVSDTYNIYDPATGTLVSTDFNENFGSGYNGAFHVVGDTLWGNFNGAIGAYDLVSDALVIDQLIDTAATAFAYDQLNGNFYVTSTDYFSYKAGLIYDRSGALQGTFDVGFSPEVVRLYNGLNHAPVAVNDVDTTTEGVDAMVMVLMNDSDADGDSLILSIVTAPLNGTAMIMNDHVHYTPDASFTGVDSVEYQICDNSPASLCTTAWAKIYVSPNVGIEELNEALVVSLFPNPATDVLTLNSSIAPEALTVTDLSGQVVLNKFGNLTNYNRLSISDLAPGMYLLNMEVNGSAQTLRFIKQ